ncbi:rho GTPase-activating protein 45-like isoform X2 [Centruroides vittatus]|uniref:rho GTPase-activating protein 45-like isoform X2 n=1 Tax=Centruroides vittatus TaxID=120091 RepID=UPI00350FAA91
MLTNTLNEEPQLSDFVISQMESSTSQPYATGHTRNASGTSANSLGAIPSRSISMNSISSDCSSESPLVEKEDIIVLTHDVRNFKDALGQLKKIFQIDKERQETTRVAAHERLGDVLRILRSILEKYTALQSTELLVAAGNLIQQVKGYNYEDEEADPTEFFESINQLALALSSRVSEYLMGDLDSTSNQVIKTRSCDNLLRDVNESESFARDIADLPPNEIDGCLMQHDHGVNLALQRAKVWSKYAKDVMTYIEKRCHLEIEHARSISKLAQMTRPILKEENFLPLQSIYCAALDQDIENSGNSVATCSVIQGPKFIDQLSNRRSEHEKLRKQIKEMWQKEIKKMHEAISNMKKAKASYFQRQQEYEKAKESVLKAESTEGAETSKVDKKRRIEDDALHKAIEAETTYKACIAEANEQTVNLEKVKAKVLKEVRELIYQCDQTMKAVTAGYFQLQYTTSTPAPVQFQMLCESAKSYEVGSQYMEFVKQKVLPYRTMHKLIPFTFEPYCGESRDRECKINEPTEEEGSFNFLKHQVLEARLSAESREKKVPSKAWNTSVRAIGSDSDSISSCPSNKSQDTSPTASPHASGRKILTVSSGDELETDHDNDGLYNYNRQPTMSKAAETHSFRKLKTLSRCRECDCYVCFQGFECSECGLPCHKKCLEVLALQCGHKRLPNKMTTFGVELTTHAEKLGGRIPHIITKCVNEIENRGLLIKGIYRVSGVKSRVEKLCQSFESGADLVDLTDAHPNVIANVLKLYLRQLPEPLLTFRYYPDFINIAKYYPSLKEEYTQIDEAVKELKILVRQLPIIHYTTLAYLMHHLKRVSDYSEHNNMPPSNLGIVFGPTLLRTSEGTASLSSLVDTVHQTRIIELLINYALEIFDDHKDPNQFIELNMSEKRKVSRTLSGTNQTGDVDMFDDNHNSVLYESAQSKKTEKQIFMQDTSDFTPSSDDLLGSSVVSDDDFPDMLPDDNLIRKSPLLPYNKGVLRQSDNLYTLQRKEILNTLDSRTQSSSPAVSETSHSSIHSVPLKSFEEDSIAPSDVGSFDEPPVPPPRRNVALSSDKKYTTEHSTSSAEDSGVNSQEETSQASCAFSSVTSVNMSSSGNRLSTSAITAELRRQFFEAPPQSMVDLSIIHPCSGLSSDSKHFSEYVDVSKSTYQSTHSTPKSIMEGYSERETTSKERVQEDLSSSGSNLYSSPLSESISSLGQRYMPSLSSSYSSRTIFSSTGATSGINLPTKKINNSSHSLVHNKDLQTKQGSNGDSEYSSQQTVSSSKSSESSQQYITTKMLMESGSLLETQHSEKAEKLTQSELSILTSSATSSDPQEIGTSKMMDKFSPSRQPRFV